MRVLSNDDVEKVLTAEECMAALKIAYREHSLGLADSPWPRVGRDNRGTGDSRRKLRDAGGACLE